MAMISFMYRSEILQLSTHIKAIKKYSNAFLVTTSTFIFILLHFPLFLKEFSLPWQSAMFLLHHTDPVLVSASKVLVGPVSLW